MHEPPYPGAAAAAPPAAAEHGPAASGECLLEVRSVCKAFPGVVALDAVSLRLTAGTVHALIGENGAGKSTLMKIVAGLYTPDAGELLLRGRPLRLRSPREALQNGIAMIHQELNLMPSMSVAENIWIGREPLNAWGAIRHGELHRRTRALLQRLRIDIDPRVELRSLSIASRQMIEIAKALSYESQLLIMDEPTSALTEPDAQRLFAVIRELKTQGKGILYISHKMDELFEIADEISVLRDGRYIGGGAAGELSRDQLIRMMVGRELSLLFPHPPAPPGAVVLAARALSVARQFHDVSFELHAGEILGVAGLIGSGRSQLAEALFGLSRLSSGRLSIDGNEVRIDSPQAAMAHGLAFVTEDRKETGCFLALSVLENLEISVLSRDFVRCGFVRARPLMQACAAVSQSLRVKTPDLHERIENLSGGNQQKVLLGRWLLTGPKILILDEPTRGVDVGAKAEIHQLVARLVSQGTAVLMISSEMPEILGMSHRIMVMREGRVTGILERAHADQVRIMELAAR
jgi:inositol transport system ATP-binding protein